MRVLAAMSGGVDSSVAAALLVEQGLEVTGVTLKLWGGEQDSGCCSVSDVEDARRVAAQLDMPHYVFNFADDFEASVVTPYLDAHAAGQTPNPCVECNRSIKFRRLLDRAVGMGFDALATGHHARVVEDSTGRRLHRGADTAKDQSYVLYMLGQRELARSIFPVGHLTKAAVRETAERLGLRTAAKAESMDVCFIKRGERWAFLAMRSQLVAGHVVDTEGRVVGSHGGVGTLTIGQRRGHGVATGERRYVVDIDATAATVTIGSRADLLRSEQPLRNLSFVAETPSASEILDVQSSAHGDVAAGRLAGDAIAWVEPTPRVAPGQVVALYRGEELVGGGVAT